jgi:hypothetical protein
VRPISSLINIALIRKPPVVHNPFIADGGELFSYFLPSLSLFFKAFSFLPDERIKRLAK